ncbi:toprim domain-containing protein [Desulfovibrio cuneatus]|uniref:toprim domain-containing protein n=1 Tax=Desulfovibrio cuneatus TaxID=159728 RepID=UPI00041CBD6C|nr:toprim domain-containing protein [Desulfovibrio cuneatus]
MLTNTDIIQALLAHPYGLQEAGSYLRKGKCPNCGEHTLYIGKNQPFIIRCERLNNCGFEENVREALPELYTDIAKRFPATPEERDRTANAYMGINRGFDISKMRGWYVQGTFPHNGKSIPTVRFYLDEAKTRWWERLIDVTGKEGLRKGHFGGKKKADGTFFQGDVWVPPGFTLEKGETCMLVEGIFHANALNLSGIKAAAGMSANHFPLAFIKSHAKKDIRWHIGLDNDTAGLTWIKKHHASLKALGELASCVLPPAGQDWDDLYRAGQLTPEKMERWQYYGRLFLAESVEQKAFYMYRRNTTRSHWLLDFENGLYNVNIPMAFETELHKAVFGTEETDEDDAKTDKKGKGKKGRKGAAEAPQQEEQPQAAAAQPAQVTLPPTTGETQAAAAAQEGATPEATPQEPTKHTGVGPIEVYLHSQQGEDLFCKHANVEQVSNVCPQFQYFEYNELLETQSYVFSVEYANGQAGHLISMEGTALTSPDSFHKALLNRSRGGTFDGDMKTLKKLRDKWLNNKMFTVAAVPYVGYDRNVKAYLFQDAAWHNGKKIPANKHGYFTINKQGIKSGLAGIRINTKGQFSPDWLENFAKAFHFQGMATLAFWMGALFVQQIRERQKSFPFLELTGEPGAGKSTILEFLWKCVGRDDYEGFDMLKSSKAGGRRAFSQVSNLPIVILESDRDAGERSGARATQFNFDEVKPFFNGRGTGTLGVAKRGNDTDESFFQGALLISQNAEVDGSTPLLERIVHCHADKKHHKLETREVARWFGAQTSDTVGGFLGAALSKEREILAAYEQAFPHWETYYTNSSLTNGRIILNHAQIAACASALRVLFPAMKEKTVEGLGEYLLARAYTREERLKTDHPLLEQFWADVEFINMQMRRIDHVQHEWLNHSKEEGKIAINLNQFREKAQGYGQQPIDMALLKKLLPTGKRHKFIEANKTVNSRQTDVGSIKCWIFQK